MVNYELFPSWAAIGKIKGGASFNQYQSFSGKILPHFLVFTIFVAQKMAELEHFIGTAPVKSKPR